MFSLDDIASPVSQIWSVEELNSYIQELFEIDFRLREVAVRGELSNYSPARSGHAYFTLKDENSQLRCVMWRRQVRELDFQPVDGDHLIARGKVSVYAASGVYQLYVDSLEEAGQGQLAAAFEALKQKLAAEGLFDESLKKPLPQFPKAIGLVTSPDAAALQDILNVLERRWPMARVVLSPTVVQGDKAAGKIIKALKAVDGRDDVEVIILSRGGGSMEDLSCFNDEELARAIAAADKPVISGVGHEIDFTIADFVSDRRAPTPSAAAELAVPDAAEIAGQVEELGRNLRGHMERSLAERRRMVAQGLRNMSHLSPRARIDSARQSLDGFRSGLDRAMGRQLERSGRRVELSAASLRAIDPGATLRRGYAIVRDGQGKIVRGVGEVAVGSRLDVELGDGRIGAKVEDVKRKD